MEEVMVEAVMVLEEEVTAAVEEVMALEEEATAVEEEVMVVEDMVEVMNISYRNSYGFVKINIYMLWCTTAVIKNVFFSGGGYGGHGGGGGYGGGHGGGYGGGTGGGTAAVVK